MLIENCWVNFEAQNNVFIAGKGEWGGAAGIPTKPATLRVFSLPCVPYLLCTISHCAHFACAHVEWFWTQKSYRSKGTVVLIYQCGFCSFVRGIFSL